MFPIVRRVKRFAVSTRSTVVYSEHDVSVVNEVLRDWAVVDPRLSSRSTVNQQQCRCLPLSARVFWFVKDGRDLETIK